MTASHNTPSATPKTKLQRLYAQLESNSKAIANGESKSYYTRQNEYLSTLIAKEEAKVRS